MGTSLRTRSVLVLSLLALGGVASAAGPTEMELRKRFARQLKLVGAKNVTGVAIVQLTADKVSKTKYCPFRTALCGKNPRRATGVAGPAMGSWIRCPNSSHQ